MEESMRTLILNIGACITVVVMTSLIGCSKSESQNPSGTLSWDSGFPHGMANSGGGSIRILHDPLTKPVAGGGSCIILEIVHPIRLVPFQSIRFFSSAVSPKVKQSMFRNQVQHRERRGYEANEFGNFEILQALPIG